MKKLVGILLIIGSFAGNGYSYGARGHGLVGAIADRRLTKNQTVKIKVRKLLDGLTLQQAATLPDSIKAWDKNPNGFRVTGHPTIEAQLRAFVKANPDPGSPSHHDFHFTDVPVFANEKYSDGPVGRSQFDIVHMIPFCIRVLKGEEPETNERAITKPVAVILLVHYLGDIHQPLHVGAEFFNAAGQAFQPTADNPGFGDQGGNKLTLFLLLASGKKLSVGGLHSYWDGQAVMTAFGKTPDLKVAQKLGSTEPANWKLSAEVEDWAETLANEILPVAGEAHQRLIFKNIKSKAGAKEIISGVAEEKKPTGGRSYQRFAAATIKEEIHKGGWRLADLLERIIQ